MKEYYKIGEISKLYGIGTDALRYYEELGILKPRRDDNGYRMYSIRDIRTLNILRELRSIGFSMQEIKAHLTDFDLSKTLSLFEQEIHTIDEKMQTLQTLKEQLTRRVQEIESHLKTGDEKKACVQSLPARKILQLSENVYRDEDLDIVIKKLQKENEDQLYLIGNDAIGATIPLKTIQEGIYGDFNSVFCIVDSDEFDAVLPPGSYFCVTVKGGYDQMPQAWNAFFAELQTRSLIPDGDPLELYIIDNHDTNNEEEYITQLQIKIKEDYPSHLASNFSHCSST